MEFVCALAGEKILYEPSKRRVTFPNGCIATTFSAEKPRRLRGPQHHFAWLDEPAHMDNIEEVWSNLLFGLRLGNSTRRRLAAVLGRSTFIYVLRSAHGPGGRP